MSRARRRLVKRLYGDGHTADARAFCRGWAALEQRLGVALEPFLTETAAAVEFGLQWQDVTGELRQAQEARQRGKGRRPTASRIASLRKRQGLSWQSYDQAVRRLEELVAPKRRRGRAGQPSGQGPNVAEQLAALQETDA